MKVLRINDISIPEQNNVCADICTGLQQPILSGVSCERRKMANADTFSTLRIVEWFTTPVFLITRKRSCFHVMGGEAKGVGDERKEGRRVSVDL